MSRVQVERQDLSNDMQLILDLIAIDRNNKGAEQTRFSVERMSQINWEAFLDSVIHHRIQPIIHKQLQLLGSPNIPDLVTDTLQTDYRKNTMRMLHLVGELDRIGKQFQMSGIRLLVLKGPLLAHSLYGDMAMRTSKDLDILVPIDDLEHAEQLLQMMGYRLMSDVPRVFKDWTWRAHHVSYIHPESRIHVELHWRMQPKYYLEPTFDKLWEQKIPSSIAGITVHQLSRVDVFLYLIVHGSRHGWFRLRWLLDIHQMMPTMTTEDWVTVIESAKRLQMMSMLGQALLLVSRLLNVHVPDFLERLANEQRSQRLAGQSLYYIQEKVQLHPTPATKALAKHYKRYLMSLLTLRKRITYSIKLLYPSSWDAIDFPLPRRLHFLYVPLRPFLWLMRSFKKERIHKGVDV